MCSRNANPTRARRLTGFACGGSPVTSFVSASVPSSVVPPTLIPPEFPPFYLDLAFMAPLCEERAGKLIDFVSAVRPTTRSIALQAGGVRGTDEQA